MKEKKESSAKERKENSWFRLFKYRFKNWFIDVKLFILKPIEKFIFGYSRDEIWNLDSKILEFIKPRLIRLIKIKHGISALFFKDELDMVSPKHKTEWYIKKQDNVLMQILWLCEHYDDDLDNFFIDEKLDINKFERHNFHIRKRLRLLAEYFTVLYD